MPLELKLSRKLVREHSFSFEVRIIAFPDDDTLENGSEACVSLDFGAESHRKPMRNMARGLSKALKTMVCRSREQLASRWPQGEKTTNSTWPSISKGFEGSKDLQPS